MTQHDQDMPENLQVKSAPGGSGKTDMTPPAKKKSSGSNVTSECCANAPPGATFENSPSESAGGAEQKSCQHPHRPTMLKQLLLLLLLNICIAPQAANGLETQAPIHHVPRRLRQTRLFTPTERATAPLLPNNYCGSPLGPKASGHMRLLMNNPNRVSAQNDFVDFQHICQRMLAHDVDIFGLPESGVDWKQGHPRNRCNQILRDFWPHSRLIGSTSDIPSKEVVQHGGTCI